jgi:hypothetical protein
MIRFRPPLPVRFRQMVQCDCGPMCPIRHYVAVEFDLGEKFEWRLWLSLS